MTQSQHKDAHICVLSTLSLALAYLLLMPVALAQQSGDADATTLDQINVTARQRSERLQDVPIAVTALNAADIRNAGINQPRDFIALTPNVNFQAEDGSGTSFITIRGIAQVRNSEQPVAVVVDGVAQISARQFNQELFDITQIEVLKGPQGALYGNNSIGGAINITTAEPGDSFGGYVQAGTGNGRLNRAQGSFGGALDGNGRWRGQASMLYSDFGGLIKNETLGRNVNGVRSKHVRLRLLGQINDALALDFQASNSNGTAHSPHYVYQPVYGISDAGNPWLPVTANNLTMSERKLSQLSFKIDWQHTWGSLTSISAWSRVSEWAALDQFPYTAGSTINPLPGWEGLDGTQGQYHYTSGFSQELRLTSHPDQRLRWIAGAYGQFVNNYVSTTVGDDLEQGPGNGRRKPLPPGSHSPTTSFLADDKASDTLAVFAQLAYDLTPRLEAALAMRYDHAKRSQTDVAPPEFSPNSGTSRSATFNAFQPKLSLTWKPHHNLSAFASIGRGFNSGGFNQTGIGAIAAAAGTAGVDDQYEKSIADSYELGIKSRPVDWFELNASAFYTDFKNQHYFVFVGELGAQVIAPINKTRLQGVEIEAKLIPARNLSIFGSYGYTDSEILENIVDPAVIGNRSPYVPQSTVNFGTQYKLELGETANVTLRIDYRRMGKQYWDTRNSTARPAVNLIDARMIFQPTASAWSLTLWGRNLGNKIYLEEWVPDGFVRHAQPRSYGADFRYDF